MVLEKWDGQMAEVNSRGSQKRKPDKFDTLESEQRLAKRFDLLNIGTRLFFT